MQKNNLVLKFISTFFILHNILSKGLLQEKNIIYTTTSLRILETNMLSKLSSEEVIIVILSPILFLCLLIFIHKKVKECKNSRRNNQVVATFQETQPKYTKPIFHSARRLMIYKRMSISQTTDLRNSSNLSKSLSDLKTADSLSLNKDIIMNTFNNLEESNVKITQQIKIMSLEEILPDEEEQKYSTKFCSQKINFDKFFNIEAKNVYDIKYEFEEKEVKIDNSLDN